MTDKIYDIVIIGGGPAGLSAGQYAARANLHTIILDKSPTAGALAYSSKIENYPGIIEPVSGNELLDRFRKQAIRFGAEYKEAQVVGVNFDADIKEVHAMDNIYHARAVIIATGSMGRKPVIPGEERLLGKGVSYCATCDAAFYRDQTVSIIGDSDEALKEVDVLAEFAETVYIITPSKELKIPLNHPPLNNDKVQVLTGHNLVSIEGDETVTGIKIRETATREVKKMKMDGVFIYLQGSQPIVDFLQSSLEKSEKGCLMTHRTMETSIPGVFAAGDVTCGEVRQVVIAAAYGCSAALSAEKYIRQRKRISFDWQKS